MSLHGFVMARSSAKKRAEQQHGDVETADRPGRRLSYWTISYGLPIRGELVSRERATAMGRPSKNLIRLWVKFSQNVRV